MLPADRGASGTRPVPRRFDAYVDSLIGVIDGGREKMSRRKLSEETSFDRIIASFEESRLRPDGTLWYAVSWAEGAKPPTESGKQTARDCKNTSHESGSDRRLFSHMDSFHIENSSNRRSVRIGPAEYLLVDLTQPLQLDVEVYPGDPKPQKEIFSDIDETGYQHHIYRLGDHNFHPHGDAPSHQNADMKHLGFETFDLSYCFNSAFMIDLSDSAESVQSDGIRFLTRVEKKHLEASTDLLSEVSAVVIRTGYDNWLETNRPHSTGTIPYLADDASEFLAGFPNIKVVGIDSITIDPPGSHASHRQLRDRMIVESLVHLHEIPEEIRTGFDLQTAPVRIVGATGGPVAAYAFIQL